jgi:hypothetical protein
MKGVPPENEASGRSQKAAPARPERDEPRVIIAESCRNRAGGVRAHRLGGGALESRVQQPVIRFVRDPDSLRGSSRPRISTAESSASKRSKAKGCFSTSESRGVDWRPRFRNDFVVVNTWTLSGFSTSTCAEQAKAGLPGLPIQGPVKTAK